MRNWIALFVLAHASLAHARALSTQARAPGQSWQEVSARLQEQLEKESPGKHRDRSLSARGAAVPLQRLDLSDLPEWDLAAADEAFKKVRDTRFLYLGERPDFLRRISWLFPDDGCFARASYAGRKLNALGYPRPRKLFVFGDLALRTPNAPGGWVHWWYHVASAIKIGGVPYVLDPSVEPDRPLSFREWLDRLHSSAQQSLYSNCNPFSYAYYSRCKDASAPDEAEAPVDEGNFLRLEWMRLQELGRNPLRELGENPPWRASSN